MNIKLSGTVLDDYIESLEKKFSEDSGWREISNDVIVQGAIKKCMEAAYHLNRCVYDADHDSAAKIARRVGTAMIQNIF